MARKSLIHRISEATGLPLPQARVILDTITKTMIEHTRQSTGDGIYIKGLGNFQFKAYENFGSVNIHGGGTKVSDVLLTYVRTLQFIPGKQLARELEDKNLDVDFNPIKEFNSRKVIGELKLPKQGEA